jgi:hypothetical protein
MPENTDTRLTRVEEQIKGAVKDLEVLWPLPAQWAVHEERIASVQKDINKGFNALRDEINEMKQTSSERAKERRTMLIALFVAGVGLFGTFVATAVPLIRGNPAPSAQERTK